MQLWATNREENQVAFERLPEPANPELSLQELGEPLPEPLPKTSPWAWRWRRGRRCVVNIGGVIIAEVAFPFTGISRSSSSNHFI
jgi:hypothetical protein